MRKIITQKSRKWDSSKKKLGIYNTTFALADSKLTWRVTQPDWVGRIILLNIFKKITNVKKCIFNFQNKSLQIFIENKIIKFQIRYPLKVLTAAPGFSL